MIDIEVDSMASLNAAFMELRRRLSPAGLAEFLEVRVDPYLHDKIALRFANEGDADVGAWAGLAKTTSYLRSRQGFGAFHPINRRTGALMRFVTDTKEISPQGGGAQLTKPARGGTRELQTKLRHAQQGGVSTYGNPFPARPVLALSGVEANTIITRLSDWMGDAMLMAQGAL